MFFDQKGPCLPAEVRTLNIQVEKCKVGVAGGSRRKSEPAKERVKD